MDSDESRGASSGDESEGESGSEGPKSPQSQTLGRNSDIKSPDGIASPRSSRSRSRSNSSGSESRHSGPHSPKSPISGNSRSRSHDSVQQSDDERPQSPDSRPQSRDSRPQSHDSRPQSVDSETQSPCGRPRTPKSPESITSPRSGPRSPLLPSSRPHTRTSRSPVNSDGPRSLSPTNSSRSNSPINSSQTTGNHLQNNNCSKPSNHSNSFRNSHSPMKSPSSNHDDQHSIKSDKSRSSNKSKSLSPDRLSEASEKSGSSRVSRQGREAANLDDGNTSDSSISSIDSSSRKNKNISKNVDTQPEEISDGEMESDHDKNSDVSPKQSTKEVNSNLNISHEDLSDVSDLDDSMGQSDEELIKTSPADLRAKIDDNRNKKPEIETKLVIEKTSRTDEGEEQLDFEAEEGECADEPTKEMEDKLKEDERIEAGEVEDDRKTKEPEELEEGELTDEDDARPEETEPRPVCRFFSRGQCTWGASCRFLHPGVTDKGNYTMFEMIRPVVPGDYGGERMLYGGRPEPPPVESAWERGLRTAKEMLRKSIKRKEQDIDFEEKKMNLSLAQEELDKENGYYARAPSPEPRYVSVRHPAPVDYPPPVARPPQDEYYGRRQVIYEPEYVPPPARERVRSTSYRELPSHRMPDYFNNKYEDEPTQSTAKVRRTKREVIVQRAEERPARGDEWSDPWMRSKSPAGGRKGSRRRSYSSGSSYSSSSTSGSTRSSYKSRSRSPRHRRSPRTHKRQVSPSVIVSERKAANERAALMNPPAPRKKAPSPGMMRLGAQNPPAPSKVDQFGRTRSKLAVAAALARVKGRTRSSRSSSGSSSGSSSSDSDSSGSSSSSSRDASPSPRRPTGVDLAMALKAKAIDALKTGSEKRQIKLTLKNPVGAKKPDLSELARKAEIVQGKKRPANSPPAADPKSLANKKTSSRREELLKQLKAVEDAIAKKRSKVN